MVKAKKQIVKYNEDTGEQYTKPIELYSVRLNNGEIFEIQYRDSRRLFFEGGEFYNYLEGFGLSSLCHDLMNAKSYNWVIGKSLTFDKNIVNYHYPKGITVFCLIFINSGRSSGIEEFNFDKIQDSLLFVKDAFNKMQLNVDIKIYSVLKVSY